MGNSSSTDSKANSNAAEHSGSFNKRELVCIKELYARLLVEEENATHDDSATTTTSSSSSSSTTTLPIMLPHLRNLLSKRGVLKDITFFCQFLDEAMRINSSQTLEVIWDLWGEGDNSTVFAMESSNRLCLFFELLIEIAMCHRSEVNQSSQKAMAEMLVASVMKSNMNNNDDTNTDQKSSSSHQLMMLKQWCALYGPRTAKVFESYLTELCFPHEHNPSFFPYRAPSFIGKYPLSDVLPNGALDLLPLSLYHESLQGDWTRLYSSSVDGLSFNRMAHHVMGYDGPMCFIIKPQRRNDCVFGAFTSGRWREFNRFYGSSDTFLFTLRPSISIIRNRDRSNGNYQWLNQVRHYASVLIIITVYTSLTHLITHFFLSLQRHRLSSSTTEIFWYAPWIRIWRYTRRFSFVHHRII